MNSLRDLRRRDNGMLKFTKFFLVCAYHHTEKRFAVLVRVVFDVYKLIMVKVSVVSPSYEVPCFHCS